VQGFSLLPSVQTGSGTHLASYPMGKGGRVFASWLKLQGSEADHSPPSRILELYLHSHIYLHVIVLN
jgi:hypothetical protein